MTIRNVGDIAVGVGKASCNVIELISISCINNAAVVSAVVAILVVPGCKISSLLLLNRPDGAITISEVPVRAHVW